jgi:hypothetical protein
MKYSQELRNHYKSDHFIFMDNLHRSFRDKTSITVWGIVVGFRDNDSRHLGLSKIMMTVKTE